MELFTKDIAGFDFRHPPTAIRFVSVGKPDILDWFEMGRLFFLNYRFMLHLRRKESRDEHC